MNTTRPTVEHRDIRCTYSEGLPSLLTRLRLSVLISTYQTGHVIVVAARQGRLVLGFHQFEQAMGLAVKPGCIAVCSRGQVWFLRNAPDIAAKLEPRGAYDGCFMTRTSHFTDDMQAHEAAWIGDEFWVVNTLFSCLAALHPYYSFGPRWRPRFISAVRPEDRCHLNGLAVNGGRPCFVTALGETDTPQGWRANKAGGCLVDVPSGQVVAGGLSLPHSPRVDGEYVWFLHTGLGRLDRADPRTGQIEPVADLPGIGRGLALHGDLAFAGLSRARPTLTGVPIVERAEQLKCGVAVVDRRSGRLLEMLEFLSTVEEIFDVQLLPGITFPYLSGPWAARDMGQPFWTIPPTS